MTGIKTAVIIVSVGCSCHMNDREIAIRTMILRRLVICSEIKRLTVSTSEVQRWIISPVSCAVYHENGRCSMWLNSRSRMDCTSLSAPAEVK